MGREPRSAPSSTRSAGRLRPFKPLPFGPYTLLSTLSPGGMGELFIARREDPSGKSRLCVVKKILPQLANDRDFLQRFVSEARTIATLNHPGIAKVLDSGLQAGKPYIALEYVDGKDLRKVHARAREAGAGVPLPISLWVVIQVLDALAYVHNRVDGNGRELGLVHRDASPANILVSYDGVVKLIDFGLAKSKVSSAQTNPSMIVGKFLYMSPEQARHAPLDHRSDLFSVGMCLYELISGRNPNEELEPNEIVSRLLNPTFVPLRILVPSCPKPVSNAVMKAISADPRKRHESAAAFAAELQKAYPDLSREVTPAVVAQYMRSLYASEYESERRMLWSFEQSTAPGAPRLGDLDEEANTGEITVTDAALREVTEVTAPHGHAASEPTTQDAPTQVISSDSLPSAETQRPPQSSSTFLEPPRAGGVPPAVWWVVGALVLAATLAGILF